MHFFRLFSRLLSKHFRLQPFFPKDSVSLLFAKFTVSKFRSPVRRKMHFSHFFWLQKHSLHIVCLERQPYRVLLGNLKKSWLLYQSQVEKIEFHNSIQDWAFTPLYSRLNACLVENTQRSFEKSHEWENRIKCNVITIKGVWISSFSY